MSAYLFCQFTILLQNRMLVFSHQSLLFCLRQEAVRTQIVHFRLDARSGKLLAIERIPFYRIFIGKTFRSGQLIQTAIRLRSHHIVLDFNHLPVCRTNQGRSMITVAEVRTSRIGTCFYQRLPYHRLGVHSDQRSHAVAPMNVECLRYGT